MDFVLDSRTDEEITTAIHYYQHQINKFLLKQFIQSQYRSSQVKSKISEAVFADSLLKHCTNNKTCKIAVSQSKKYFESVSDDVIIHMFKFIGNDDVLIHKSLIVLNKRFNHIIKHNYNVFNYIPDFKAFTIKINSLLEYCGKIIDFRLNDGSQIYCSLMIGPYEKIKQFHVVVLDYQIFYSKRRQNHMITSCDPRH